VNRLRGLAPITAISQELVRFDLQKLENPEISGIEYQQGNLLGYEIREYLLEKWGRECAYCTATDTPLQIEHIAPKASGGSNRISNLTLACHDCNQEKDRSTPLVGRCIRP
ncbi:MAG: HNH endonuclease, partial [Halomonas sp.]